MIVSNEWIKAQIAHHRSLVSGPVHSFSRNRTQADEHFFRTQEMLASAFEELLNRRLWDETTQGAKQ